MRQIKIVLLVMCITLGTICTGWVGAKTPPPQEIDWQEEALKKDIQVIELTINIFRKQLLDAKRALNSYLLEKAAKEEIVKERPQKEDSPD